MYLLFIQDYVSFEIGDGIMSWEVTGQCPKCGTDLLDGAKFCMRCGYTTEEEAKGENVEDSEVSPMEKLGLVQEEEIEQKESEKEEETEVKADPIEEKKEEKEKIKEKEKEPKEEEKEKKEIDIADLDISFEELKPLADELPPPAAKSAKDLIS